MLPTAKVLPQRPIRRDVDIDDVEGVLAARVPHAEDQEPLPEGRGAREASAETLRAGSLGHRRRANTRFDHM